MNKDLLKMYQESIKLLTEELKGMIKEATGTDFDSLDEHMKYATISMIFLDQELHSKKSVGIQTKIDVLKELGISIDHKIQ